MASTPTPDDLTSVLTLLATRLANLEERLDRIEIGSGTIRSAATMQEPSLPKSTKGKGRANAPQASSTATSAKKKNSTKKVAIPSSPVHLPLAQTFTTEGKADRHLVTVVIPDTTAQHVIGQAGKGLKQIHDISGARVNAYTLVNGSSDERHVSIRGTDLQIGDALVVLGKRIARKKVRPPKAKKPSPTVGSSTPAPLLSTQQSSSLPRYNTTQRRGPSTGSHIVEVPTGETDESLVMLLVPTVAMASPSPASTPTVPSVTMGSPTPSPSTGALTPMQIDALRERVSLTGRQLAQLRGTDPPEYRQAAPSRGLNTARHSGTGPPGNRGRR
jgi:hypothetical protein